MEAIRKNTFTLEQYLMDINEEKIRTDQDCQRLSGQWTPNMINELIANLLIGLMIPNLSHHYRV